MGSQARPISFVRVDVARLGIEIYDRAADPGALVEWVKSFHRALALQKPELNEYAAELLAEAQNYAETKRQAAKAMWKSVRGDGEHVHADASTPEHVHADASSTPAIHSDIQTSIHKEKYLPVAPRPGGDGLVSKGKKSNPLWDALVAAFQLNPVSKNEQSGLGGLVKTLKAKGAEPEDVQDRLDRYRLKFPGTPTPHALVKHWDLLPPPAPRQPQNYFTADGVSRAGRRML